MLILCKGRIECIRLTDALDGWARDDVSIDFNKVLNTLGGKSSQGSIISIIYKNGEKRCLHFLFLF